MARDYCSRGNGNSPVEGLAKEYHSKEMAKGIARELQGERNRTENRMAGE